MVQKRWSCMTTALVLGTLAAVDVNRDPSSHSLGPQIVRVRPHIALAAMPSMAPAAVVQNVNNVPTDSGACPNDMVEVTGEYCPAPEQICAEFISEKRDRCERFRTTVRCLGKPSDKHFCIDRYEYPNEAGRQPTLAVTWDEARDVCTNEGKRLCMAEEWTLACEGPERKPYPFGYVRDATACNFDKNYIMPDNFAFNDPQTRAAEVARVNQSEPSGTRPRCVSDYGVYDMTGNADEWVVNEHGSPQGPEYQSGLKGGYWGPVRNRCRPMTTEHNQWHQGYQIGFRCCKDTGGNSEVLPKNIGDQTSGQPDAKNWKRSASSGTSRS